MPTLDWIGKKAVVKHHKDVPYRLLEPVAELSHDVDSGNLIVQGDNLHALKALLPRYAGKVKCIYIDPPYNTGEDGGDGEGWIYSDKVNSPEITKWLGQVVGKEDEDLSRHDKWLCMIYPRIRLLKNFLRKDGVIFVSIDDNEVATLKLVLEEIFGKKNFLGCMVWKRRSSSAMARTPLSTDHEYIYCFANDIDKVTLYGLDKDIDKYPLQDARGKYASTDLTVGMDKNARPNQFFLLENPRTKKTFPPNPNRVWRFAPETMKEVIKDDLIIWPDESTRTMTRPRYKTYYNPNSSKPTPVSTWIESIGKGGEDEDVFQLESGMTSEGGKVLKDIFGRKEFDYPKPPSLITSVIRASTKNNDLVLDSFSGSGTTGHAVLKQNLEDGGNRKFIMVEMDANIASNVTAERIRRVANGYTTTKGKDVEGLGSGFQFCQLSDEPLFNADGQIRSDVTFSQLAEFVWFAETGSGFTGSADSPLLGTYEGRAIYLLYNGILRDRSVNGGNVLTTPVLEILPVFNGSKVIYAAACRLGNARLNKLGIQFKQTPYALEV